MVQIYILVYIPVSVIHFLNGLKDRNHMFISTDKEKAFDKIQFPFIIKSHEEIQIRMNIPQSNKGYIYMTNL